MSRKNKALRAFLHQNKEPTIEEAWNSAWRGAQKTFHARSMQEMRGQVDRLREALAEVKEFMEVELTGTAWADCRHMAHSINNLLAELDNLEEEE